MRLKPISLTMLLCSMAAGIVHAQLPDSLNSVPRSIDLSEIVVQANGIQKYRKNARVTDPTLRFRISETGATTGWDSSYLLTRFPSPSSRNFKLVSVEGRIADFDTGKFDMYLTVLQLSGTDTLFRLVPIRLGAEKRTRHRHLMHIRDHGIVLKPAPFYLGYGFHTKPISEEFTYRLYAAIKGEGASLRIKKGNWHFTDVYRIPMPYIFPFRITYLEQ